MLKYLNTLIDTLFKKIGLIQAFSVVIPLSKNDFETKLISKFSISKHNMIQRILKSLRQEDAFYQAKLIDDEVEIKYTATFGDGVIGDLLARGKCFFSDGQLLVAGNLGNLKASSKALILGPPTILVLIAVLGLISFLKSTKLSEFSASNLIVLLFGAIYISVIAFSIYLSQVRKVTKFKNDVCCELFSLIRESAHEISTK